MASRGVNKVILVDLYKTGLSTTQVSSQTGIPLSTVSDAIRSAGVMRERASGIRLASEQGRLGSGFRGKKREFTKEHKENIRRRKLDHSERNAVGFSIKPNGYVEVTKGKNKGRLFHRVVMENELGRPLLDSETVHHIDKNKLNNTVSNLVVMNATEHASFHAKENYSNRNRNSKGRFI